MQSIIVFIGIALVLSVILSNFLKLVDKKQGEDFSFKEYLKAFRIKNIDIKLVIIFVILLEIFYGYIPMPQFILYIPVLLALLLTFCVDLKYMIIPDTSSTIIFICGVIKLITNFSVAELSNVLLGGVIGGAFFLVINYIFEKITKKTGFGFGDIKLLASLGVFLGYKDIIVIMILSVFISAAVSLVYLCINLIKKVKEEYLPFGPFIVLSTFIVMMIKGERIISLYLNFIDNVISKII